MSRRPDKRSREPEVPSSDPYLWRFEALARHARQEDPEVRAWAVARLIQHYPERCADAISSAVLDEALGIADKVAEHLGRYGTPRHVPLLERAFRHGTEHVPGAALDAMARLGHRAIEELAASAVSRQD